MYPDVDLRPASFERLGAAGGDDPFGAMHRQARQRSDARAVPQISDDPGFRAASQEEMAQDIRSTGFFNNKAKSVIGAARKILADFGGEVPREMEELLTVPGAARKTANVVLGTAFRHRLRRGGRYARSAHLAGGST